MMDCGLHRAPAGFFEGLRDLCHENGALLIFDEPSRRCKLAGRAAPTEHYGVRPDTSASPRRRRRAAAWRHRRGWGEIMQLVGNGSVIQVRHLRRDPLVLYVANVVLATS